MKINTIIILIVIAVVIILLVQQMNYNKQTDSINTQIQNQIMSNYSAQQQENQQQGWFDQLLGFGMNFLPFLKFK